MRLVIGEALLIPGPLCHRAVFAHIQYSVTKKSSAQILKIQLHGMFLHLFVIYNILTYIVLNKNIYLFVVDVLFIFSVTCKISPSQWRLLPEMKDARLIITVFGASCHGALEHM